MKLKTEGQRDEFQISQADFDLSRFHFGQVAAVDTRTFSHFELSPTLRFAEFAYARAEARANIAGHLVMMVCSLYTTNRL